MMKFKKFLAAAMTGTMMFGVVAAAAPAVAVYADEAKLSEYTIEINYWDYTATISSETKSDPYVILEVLKDESGSKVSSTYVYEMNGYSSITVDISFLKATKPSYLRVRGSSEPETQTSKVETVNAQQAKISVKYTSGQIDTKKTDAENLAAAFANGKTKITAEDIQKDLYQYRTLYGSEFWYLSDFNQAITEVAGTTIVVRKAAVTEDTDKTKNAPASAEVKVKIAAAPKAPKVTVDYAKGSIKLPKNAEAQLVYEGEAGEEVPASMELDTSKGSLWVDKGDGTFIEVVNGDLENYFEVSDTGVPSLAAAAASYTFAKDSDGNALDAGVNAVDYVIGTPKTTASAGSTVTPWQDVTVTTATPEEILGWFDATKTEEKTEELVASGYTLVVRTKAGKKAASNANILVIEGAATPEQTVDKDELKVGNDTLTWETVANGIKYTGTGFEYYDSAKSKWVAIKSGNVVKTTVSADVKVTVRKAGVKATKTTAGVLPSASIEITAKKYVDPSVTPTPSTKEPAAKPEAGNAGEVKVGGAVVLTIARDGDTNTTINFTTADGKTDVVATLEYRIGSTGDYAAIPATLADQGTGEITINVRVKATETNAASEPLAVVISSVGD